ncbi:MAG: Hpt domain-containing protein, partial [Gemmobacter sp.]
VTATRRMRAQGLLGHTPVIALTAQAAPNRVQMLRDAGMVEVVIKPVSLVVLDQIMRQQVAVAQAAGQLPAPAAEPAEPALIDEDQLAGLIEDMGGDFLRDMVAKFDTDMSTSITEMAAAIHRNDVRMLSHVAHKAAGMAAVLTFSALSAELRQLENAATEEPGETLAQRCDRVADIRGKTLARVRQRLQAAA